MPVAGSHVPAVWQTSLALQSTSLAVCVHAPLVQTSFVHRLPSLVDADPSFLAGFVHMPVAGSHVPAVWQTSLALQVMSLAGCVHAPLVQTSFVHRLPSS